MKTSEEREAAESEQKNLRRLDHLAKRASREIRKAAQTGKISYFLRKQSEQNESVRNAVSSIENEYNAPELLAATITYSQSTPPKDSTRNSSNIVTPRPLEQVVKYKIFDICENGVAVRYKIPAYKQE